MMNNESRYKLMGDIQRKSISIFRNLSKIYHFEQKNDKNNPYARTKCSHI